MLPFGIGFSEILVVLLVLIVFVGPEGIPQAIRVITKVIRAIRSMVDEVKYSAEFDEVKREILQPLDEARRFDPRKQAEAWVKQELEQPLKELSKEPVEDFQSVLSTTQAGHSNHSNVGSSTEFTNHASQIEVETTVPFDEADDDLEEDDELRLVAATDPLERGLDRFDHLKSVSEETPTSFEDDQPQEESTREDHYE